MHKQLKQQREAETRRLDFTPVTFESEMVKDCNYLIVLPNGEIAWLMYSNEEGPTLSVSMSSPQDKTYIEVLNGHCCCPHYEDLDDMR